MTSLYNVVAWIYEHHVLEVCLVTKQNEDPFVNLDTVLYTVSGVDKDHAPLLYGPYCVYKSLDGHFYRVEYDLGVASTTRKPHPAMIKIPWKVAWKIQRIKVANVRYMVVVLHNPVTKEPMDHVVMHHHAFHL
jgi:hypothetical protein